MALPVQPVGHLQYQIMTTERIPQPFFMVRQTMYSCMYICTCRLMRRLMRRRIKVADLHIFLISAAYMHICEEYIKQ